MPTSPTEAITALTLFLKSGVDQTNRDMLHSLRHQCTVRNSYRLILETLATMKILNNIIIDVTIPTQKRIVVPASLMITTADDGAVKDFLKR